MKTSVRVPMILVVVATATAGLTFDRAFAMPWLLAVVAVSAGCPVLLLVTADRLGDRRHRAGLALRIVVHAVSAAAVFSLVRSGALQLLAVTLPAPPVPSLLMVPAAILWLGAAVGTEVVLMRTRTAGLLTVLPAALVLAAAALLGPGTPLDTASAAIVGACAAAQLLRGAERRGRAGAVLAVLGAAAVAMSPLAVPYARPAPVDVRAAVPRSLLAESAVNPLDLVDGWLTAPDRLLFSAVTDRPVRYWRLAVLDHFDDEQWQPPSRYLRAGLGVPPAESASGAATATIRQSVTVGGLDGPFLPSVDRPTRIGPPISAVDPDSGTLLSDAPVRDGVTYSLVSNERGTPTDESCMPDPAVPPEDPSLYVPSELSGRLDGPAVCDGSFGGFADGVMTRLNDGRRNLAHSPATGTSIGAMLRFLDGDRAGTIVEFAAAFALTLRAAHLPSRLVVGFEPAAARPGEPQRIYGRDIRVWVETRLRESGWTAYHVAPPPAQDPRHTNATPQSPPPPASDSVGLPPPTTSPSPDSDVRRSERPSRWLLALTAIPAIGYVLAAGLVPAARRFRRRHTGTPASRCLGAWHDVLDELAHTRSGRGSASELLAATPASTRNLVRGRWPDLAGPATTLCRAVEVSLFDPPGSAEPGQEDIREAWVAADAVRRRLRRRHRMRRLVRLSTFRPPLW